MRLLTLLSVAAMTLKKLATGESARDRYLAQAQDVAELERRQRALDRCWTQ